MGARIITLQRQARELGRLRTGYTDTSGARPRPVRSTTWIATSHSAEYCEAAAGIWGGTVEKWKPLGAGAEQFRVITETAAVDAILPPGDPLAQYYEAWSRGGCSRRCDGETELLSDSPCLCVQDWGPQWHTVAGPRDGACQMTTRLGVILPDLPDMGAWRVETHSYYSASEIAAAVDTLKGQLGTAAMVPVRLRIEPRTRVAGGRTKQFPVVTLGLRGATAGQVMAGQIPTQEIAAPDAQGPAAVGGQEQAPALPSAPSRDWVAEVAQAATLDDLRALYRDAVAVGEQTPEMAAAMKARADELVADQAPPPTPDPVVDEDLDDLWMRCVAAAPDGWSTTDLTAAYSRDHDGQTPGTASVDQLRAFLGSLKDGTTGAPSSTRPTLDALKGRAAEMTPPPGDDTPPF